MNCFKSLVFTILIAVMCAFSIHANLHELDKVTRAGNKISVARKAPVLKPSSRGRMDCVQEASLGPVYLKSEPKRNVSDDVTLYGYVLSGVQQGMYSTSVGTNASLNLLSSGMLECNAGFYKNGKYYLLNRMEFGGMVFANSIYIYDTETWSQLNYIDMATTTIATALTYNPKDDTVYGCFYNDDQTGYEFGTLSAETGVKTTISSLDCGFVVIAANNSGEVYGISDKGDLYQFDVASGTPSLIGATGFIPENLQGGCFDYATGDLYWFAYGKTDNGLFIVDTTTGIAEKVGNWSNGALEWVGVFSKSSSSVSENVDPSYVDDLKVNFVEESLSGTISFIMPTKDFNGTDLTGDLSYYIYVDDVQVATGNSSAGSSVTENITVTEGRHKFSVAAANESGKGQVVFISKYIGYDIPLAPTSVKVSETETGEISIAWDSVTKGLNDGYVGNVSYNVTRMPDNVLVGENVTDTICVDNVAVNNNGTYFYHVVAINGSHQSENATSNTIIRGSTSGIIPPYYRAFNDGNGLDFYTVIDSNNDGSTWINDEKHVFYLFNEDNAADDWLITPAFQLEAGKMYRFGATMASANPSFTERFEIKYGKEPTAEAMTEPVINSTETNTTFNVEQWITPKEDGIYYIGIHAISDKYQWGLYILDLSVGAAEAVNGPNPPTMIVKAGEKGAMTADISFTCPYKTIAGEDYEKLTKAEVTNVTTGEVVAVVTDLEKGGTYSVTDNNPAHGFNIYSVLCYNENGAGRVVQNKCWVGLDTPLAVANAHWHQEGNKAVITWDAPGELGLHGGYVDPEGVSYRVWDLNDYVELTSGLKANTYSATPKMYYKQLSVSYAIYSDNEAGTGGSAVTNLSAFGTPYGCPFSESFQDAKLTTVPWILERYKAGVNCVWSLTSGDGSISAYDGDKGMAVYIPNEAGGARLISPMINLTSLSKPILKLWVYNPDSNSQFSIGVSNNGVNWETVSSLPAGSASEWTPMLVDLSNYVSYERMQIALQAQSVAAGSPIYVDAIELANDMEYDLAVKSVELCNTPISGDTANVAVTIYNAGSRNVDSYTVELYNDGNLVGSEQKDILRSDEEATIEFEVPTTHGTTSLNLKAIVICDDDKALINNEMSVELPIANSYYSAPVDLDGNLSDGEVKLSWTEPSKILNKPVTEDIEDMESWSVGGIDVTFDNSLNLIAVNEDEGYLGDFKVIDNDHRYTQFMAGALQLDFPHRGDGMACQVFDLNDYDNSNSSIVAAHSGNKMLCFWASPEQNDDYLIFPELSAKDKHISFWAKSMSNKYGLECFDIVVSTTGDNREDFELFQTVTDVPAGYKDSPEAGYSFYEFDLPADTKFVAIHYNAKDVLALLVDDITYTPANGPEAELLGYNVYRDDVKINEALVSATTYSDMPPKGKYRYNVTGVFDGGESNYSNSYEVECSGINNIELKQSIYGADGYIVIEGHASDKIEIYTSDGKLLRYLTANNRTLVTMPKGIYLVKVNNHNATVIVY